MHQKDLSTPASARWFSWLQGVALLAGGLWCLWRASAAPPLHTGLWVVVLAGSAWSVGAQLKGRIGLWQVLMIESAALATATAAMGLLEWHRVFKPLVMVFAIAFVMDRSRFDHWASRFNLNLALALLFSMLGDIALMFEGYFIPGLVAFLIAHVLYILLFKRGVSWFPSKAALAITLAIGAGMYAFLWVGGLPAGLRFPVLAYVTVIALMAAQAFGRHQLRSNRASLGVAIGAGFFMLSDALLATNRFVQPLPLSQVWVLSTYYIAQYLIAVNARPVAKR